MNHQGDLSNGDTGRVSENQSLVPYRNPAPLQLANNSEADFEDEGSLGIADYWLMVRSLLLILA